MVQAEKYASTKFPLIHIFGGLCILGLFVVSYYHVLSWMYIRFTGADSYYTHGFLIPFISGFLIWQKREQLKTMNTSMSWWGLVLIIGALFIHLLGTILYIFFISGFSILILVIGLCLFLFGREIFQAILFPIFFLAFMLPVPDVFLNFISFPLKTIVTISGFLFTKLFGIPALREGFHIIIPAGDLVVGNPCSGLRSIIALLALGALFAYVSNLSIIKKFILFFLAIPIAILSNIIRVPILILVANYWGIAAAAPDTVWHSTIGIFVFVIALFLLYGVSRILGRKN